MDKPGKTLRVSPTLPTGRRLPTSFTAPSQQHGMNLISGNDQTSSRLPAFSLFFPGSCPNNRDRRRSPLNANTALRRLNLNARTPMEHKNAAAFALTCFFAAEPSAPLVHLQTRSAVLGSGLSETAALMVIVSTKKSHPFRATSGVVIVTDVIGCAAPEVREILPNPLVEKSGAMPT